MDDKKRNAPPAALDIEVSDGGIGMDIENEGAVGGEAVLHTSAEQRGAGTRITLRGSGVGLRVVQRGPGVGFRSIVTVK